MTVRNFLMAVVFAGLAASSYALAPEFVTWGQGPVQFIMTAEEAAQWKSITTDADAGKFVALFWARRDPTPETPRNEFRDEYDKRVATADKNFPGENLRGAMTERGRALIIYGLPKKIERTGTQRTSALPSGIGENTNAEDTAGQVWTYEGDEARKIFGQARVQLRFVDRHGKSNFTLERGSVDLAAAQQRVIAASIIQPNLTEIPGAEPPAPEVPAVQTELTTESLKAAVAAMTGPASGKPAFATWSEFVTTDGETFVPVSVSFPKSSGITAEQNLTFFGVVKNEAGANVLAFEEPAKLTASRDDFFVDRSLTGLPAGKYTGVFGVAENGAPLAVVSSEMQLSGSLDKDAPAISGLILSNNVYPLSEAQRPDDPFAFGGLKVVPKADKVFRPADELWYFFELRNPGLPEAPAVAEGTVPVNEGVAPAPAAPLMPKIQVKMDVEGTTADGKKVKMAAPPREIDAIALKGVPGHYGVGNAIPLATFKPGEYTFTVKAIDTVRKQSWTLSEKFRVVE